MFSRRNLLAAAGGALVLPRANAATTEEWRAAREKNLQAPDGWLSLVALEWLDEGVENTNLHPNLKLLLKNGKVTAKAGAGVTLNGNPFTSAILKPDNPGPEDTIMIGSRTYILINRGNRFGVRVRDPESKYRKQFKGLRWYPVNAAYKVEGKLVPHASPKTLTVTTVVDGLTQEVTSVGVVSFKLGGVACSLEAADAGDQLYFIFKDTTAGKTTYPAGRYMYTPTAKNGIVELDFNRAYNPPCAYNPYATCPLPRPENRLKAAVLAGELDYHFA
jgi:uncharacterized protein (DUF1684 family)